jgi:transposase
MNFIIGIDRHQLSLTSLDQNIAADNSVRLIDAFVNKLEMDKMGFQSAVHKKAGRPPFNPAILLKLYLYGYLNRVRSSRRLELECMRNVEVRWLLNELTPNYHSIADFRKIHSKQLKFVFKTYLAFLKEQQLIGAELVAIDGTKLRAQNSKKNNFNQKKISRHLGYIEDKTNEYLSQLDECDKKENEHAEVVIKKDKVKEQIEKLAQRKIKYDELTEQVKLSEDGQVSTTDPDSRALTMHHNIVEVSYNVQTAADATHSLIVDFDVINTNDINALHDMACKVKDTLEVTGLNVLADKGYHNGNELQKCESSAINTLVDYRDNEQSKDFDYNKENDSYTCPQKEQLTTSGTWYNRKRGKGMVRVKVYRTLACKTCPLKSACTRSVKGREIERSEYQDSVDRNNQRVDDNRALYKRRQAIIEHPFGTIKRSWGYTYTLVKGIEKVSAEIALIFLTYNIRRSVSILGVEELIKRLKEWKGPEYPFSSSVLRLLRTLVAWWYKNQNRGREELAYKMAA